MKTSKSSILLTLTSVLLISGCSFFTVKRNNVFFTSNDFKKYYLQDFPSLEFDSSHIEKSNKGLIGYFNVKDGTLNSYAEQINNYYQSDKFNLDYGMIYDNSYMFGIPNVFDLLKTRRLVKTTHLSFFKLYNDRYAFFYEKDEQFYEVLIKNETNTINDKDYNFYLSVSKVNQVKWSEEHLAVNINNDNYLDYLSLEIKPSTNSPGYATINVVPKNYSFALADYYLRINYTEKGRNDVYTFEGANYHDLLLKSDDGSNYEEGDIVITNSFIYKPSALILEIPKPKDNSGDE